MMSIWIFFEEILSKTFDKPKESWESLKSLGMPNKTVIYNFNANEDTNTLSHDTHSISKIFKDFSSNFAVSLLFKLSKPPDKYSLISTIIQYYSSFAFASDFYLINSTEKKF